MNNINDKRLSMNNSSGITLVALAITIIVMMIIATISIYEGRKIIKEAKVQTLETNMLAIKAKAKTYLEEVEAATWALPESGENNKADTRISFLTNPIDENGYEMENTELTDANQINQLKDDLKSATNIEAYSITENTLKKMGLDEAIEDIKDGDKYIMVFAIDTEGNNIVNVNSIDIIYTSGIEYEGNVYYTLSALQTAHDEQ